MDQECSLVHCDEQVLPAADSKTEYVVSGFAFIWMFIGIVVLAAIVACSSSCCRIWKEKKAKRERRRANRQRDLERGVDPRNGNGSNRTAALVGESRFDRPRDLERIVIRHGDGQNCGIGAGNGDGQNRTATYLVGEGRFDLDLNFALPVNDPGNENSSRSRREAVHPRFPALQDVEDAYAQRGQWREMNEHANLGIVDGWVDENESEFPVLEGIPVNPGNRNGVIVGDIGDWETVDVTDIQMEENPDRPANDEDETLPPYEEARLPEYGAEDRGGEFEPGHGEDEEESTSEQEPQEPPPVYEEFEELAYSGDDEGGNERDSDFDSELISV